MREFIHQKNLDHYRKLLAGKLDEAERERVTRLLAEEKARELPPFRARDNS